MLGYLLAAVWFFLPAGLANGTPVLASKIPLLRDWKTPMDLGKSYRGQRLFGDNKTIRGLVFGTSVGALVAALQYAIGTAPHLRHLGLSQAILAGGLMGLGALLGDAVESFFKRQRGVAPGHGWFPFDQLDYILGGLVFSYPLVGPTWKVLLAVVVTWFGIHLATVYIGYLLGVRDKPI